MQFSVVVLEDSDRPRLCGDIQAAKTWIESEHIGVVAHLIGRKNLHRAEINHCKRMVSFTGNKRRAASNIERYSVRILNARQRIPAYDLVGRRIDDNQKIYAVDCYQDVSRSLIVDSVSSAAAE